ncbi:MAG: glycoside hydrolase family 16 protein [Opitutales bacterium]|nr:glycoside hydrolase family 16 protein [Opitutales bacterium]
MKSPLLPLALLSLLPMNLHAKEWKLVWSDEFNEGALPSTEKWRYQTGGHGWGNNELEFYTDRRDENANAFIEEGKLILEARKEAYNDLLYTSARLNSRESWIYGRFVIRARVPEMEGTWPAIWMMPDKATYGDWPKSGEIDIMEHLGRMKNSIHCTLHTEAANHMKGNQRTSITEVKTATTEFHDYRVDWTPEGICGFVDDVLFFSAENETLADPEKGHAYWPYDQPFHLILNLAIGGNWGGEVDPALTNQRLEIDYVRVYQCED